MLRLIVALIFLALPARAENVLVAVAANFAGAAEALAAAYHDIHGDQIILTTGSTGKLYAQITQSAPFDVFLSADAETPALLLDEDHALEVAPYALGRLTLWVPKAAPDSHAGSLLHEGSIRHVAIANPDLAPYGKAALQAIDGMDVSGALKGKIVMGQNIGQAFSLVATGAADAGFVAASALPKDAPGFVWLVSPSLYTPIRQDAALLAHAAENEAAREFYDFLQSPEARTIISGFNYGLPE